MRIIVFFVVVASHFFIKFFELIRQENQKITIGGLLKACRIQLPKYAKTAFGQPKKAIFKRIIVVITLYFYGIITLSYTRDIKILLEWN